MRVLGALTLSMLLLAAPVVQAAQLGDPNEALSVETHGFVSPGFMVTTGNNYLAKAKNGSFEFAEVGINFTKRFSDQFRVGLQLFARDLGPIGDYAPRADWFYLDYRFRDWLGIRAGRVKTPFGLYNDTVDIDASRVAVLLPQSVYPLQSRDFLLAQTGVELYGYRRLGRFGALDYRAFAGTLYLETGAARPGSPFQLSELITPYVAGGRLMWETPLEGLRVGGSVEALRLDTKSYTEITGSPLTVGAKVPAVLWLASAEYVHGNLLLAAEYGRWHVKLESDTPTLIPNSSTDSERGYVMASYRVLSWLQPGAYYAVQFPDVTKRSGRANYQHDLAATLRFDITDYWLFKLEAHYMNGTAALSADFNNGVAKSALDRQWAMVLMKTTAYF
jgi:hypothetical protein